MIRRLGEPAPWLPLLLVLAIGLPALLTASPTLRENGFLLLMYVTLAASLNILLGYTGYVSFGHIVFFGLGGYVGFYLLAVQGWTLAAAALAGGLASGVLALLLGLSILRLRGAYFALATIGINEATRAFVNNFSPFGGPVGLSLNFAVYRDYGGAAQALWVSYDALLVLTVIVIVVSYFVRFSKFGLGLVAIREDEDAAIVMGVRAPTAKTLALVLSAVFPGILGTLFFFKNGNIEPTDAFRLDLSIEMIVMVMLGGQGTLLGPVLGAAGYELLRSYLLTSPIFKNLQLVFAGLVLLVIILFIPAGVIGWARARLPRFRQVLQ